MELASIVLASVSLLLTLGAFGFSVMNFIQLKAQSLSTHTVLPITSDTKMEDIEKKLKEAMQGAGSDQSDLNRNLHDTGLDIEDLI